MIKSLITLCFLFIILSFIDTVFSYTSDKTRLYNIIRKSMGKKDDTLFLHLRINKHVHSTTTTVGQQSNSVENKENSNMEKRDSLDSGEDEYFKWASLNRRPMESLFGRKRVAAAIASRSIGSRVNDDKRLSGLVD